MADRVIMLLRDRSVMDSALANQFLIDTGLCEELRLVLAEYEEEFNFQPAGTAGETVTAMKKKVCLGFEALTKKADFYWTLKGTAELQRRLDLYETKNKGKY